MIMKSLCGAIRAVLLGLALIALAAPGWAQQPSPNAVTLAKEIIAAKGAAAMYDPIVPGIIDRVRLMLLQTNPMLSKDLGEVAGNLRAEYASRSAELLDEVAKLYASRFTEQELKNALAFYKSPLGKKIVAEEPKILDDSLERVRAWQDKFGIEMMAKMRAEMKKKGHDL